MTKYTGIPCPACGREFTEQDDIVVCPECGAPHHRACYLDAGHCALAAQHASEFSWQGPPAPPEPPAPEPPSASRYDAASPPDYQRHYQPREAPPPPAFPPPSIDLEDRVEEIPMGDIAQFVGPGVYYYLPRFKLMSLTNRSFLPCFSAVFLSFFYYFNRKMYKIGAGLLALFLLMVIPLLILSYRMFPDMLTFLTTANGVPPDFTPYMGIVRIFNFFELLFFGASLVTGMFANKLYFNHVVRNIRQIRAEYQGRMGNEYQQVLAVRGRTNKFAVIAVVITLFLAYMAFQVLLAATYSNLISF